MPLHTHVVLLYMNVSFHEDVNECLMEPCLHGGTCENQPGSYSCHCPPGYKGQNCETGRVFTQKTCLFKGFIYMCVSYRTVIKLCFHCLCAEQDGCESDPCLNGGVCRGYRRNYLCVCKDGFFGDQCQMCKSDSVLLIHKTSIQTVRHQLLVFVTL